MKSLWNYQNCLQKIKDAQNIEPEQKCAVINAMLDIFYSYKN